jgi:D-glycero-D-manno-heptose 1,7-bisphosphate phosphatase
VPEALIGLRQAGFLLIGASNQPAAAKGKVSTDDLRAVHERVVDLLADAGLDDWRYCLHRAQDGCDCRKPRAGLLLDAARDHGIDLASSWMIGDADTDVEAGIAAGVRTVLVEHPGSAHRRSGNAQPEGAVRNLEQALTFIRDDQDSR